MASHIPIAIGLIMNESESETVHSGRKWAETGVLLQLSR